MSSICKLLVWCFCACLLAFRVEARWKPEYATLPSDVRAWYWQAQLATSRPRPLWKTCLPSCNSDQRQSGYLRLRVC
jgi:hypothetical protein